MSFIWHTFFYDPVYNALIFFIDIIPRGDVGIAIVATVVLVKTVLLPLSIKAAKTQKVMREIEPQLKELKETHKDDREAQARAMMEVYKEAGMNPFASIFVILLQIPLFIALYFSVVSLYAPIDADSGIFSFAGNAAVATELSVDESLLYSFVPVPVESSRFMFGQFDITERSLELAIIAALTMFLQMKLTLPPLKPRDPDAAPDLKDDFARNMQVQMKYIMPVLIGGIAYAFSATIALYFVVSNVTAIVQEYWVRKHR